MPRSRGEGRLQGRGKRPRVGLGGVKGNLLEGIDL